LPLPLPLPLPMPMPLHLHSLQPHQQNCHPSMKKAQLSSGICE
jgi:hypothetical protein